MGCFQMAVLLLFNISETVSYKEILAHTELPDKDLAKQVQSLIDVKLLSSTASGVSFFRCLCGGFMALSTYYGHGKLVG